MTSVLTKHKVWAHRPSSTAYKFSYDPKVNRFMERIKVKAKEYYRTIPHRKKHLIRTVARLGRLTIRTNLKKMFHTNSFKPHREGTTEMRSLAWATRGGTMAKLLKFKGKNNLHNRRYKAIKAKLHKDRPFTARKRQAYVDDALSQSQPEGQPDS